MSFETIMDSSTQVVNAIPFQECGQLAISAIHGEGRLVGMLACNVQVMASEQEVCEGLKAFFPGCAPHSQQGSHLGKNFAFTIVLNEPIRDQTGFLNHIRRQLAEMIKLLDAADAAA